MKKNLLKLLFVILCLCLFNNVKAKEVFYTNNNGVELTEEEYDYLTEIYWNGYQEYISNETYDYILGNGIGTDIERSEYNSIQLFDTSHSTSNKSIVITKANYTNYHLITVVAKWLSNPTVRSYDVIGARLNGPSLMENPISEVFNSNGSIKYNNIKNFNNGFGVSVMLPSLGNDIRITQTFKVTGSGTINASYQHATSYTNLANSQKFTISPTGYGKVFLFDSSISYRYDGMGGVDISC